MERSNRGRDVESDQPETNINNNNNSRVVTTSSGFFSFLNPRARDDPPAAQPQIFIDKFEKQYGVNHPQFVNKSFEGAFSEAKRSGKFLFVYLHCETHDLTKDFCQKVLTNDHLISFLNSNFICWGGDVFSSSGRIIAERLSVTSYPALAVVCQNNRGTITRVALFQSPLLVDDLINQLSSVLELYASNLSEIHQQQLTRQRDRNLREEQDLEFQRTLREDQEREERRREEERQKQEEEERKKREEEERLQSRERKLKSIGDEPAPGPETVELSIRLTNGTKHTRRFKVSDPMQSLFNFVDYHQLGLNISSWQVLTHFPRQIFNDGSKTFEQAGLVGKEQLFVEEKLD